MFQKPYGLIDVRMELEGYQRQRLRHFSIMSASRQHGRSRWYLTKIIKYIFEVPTEVWIQAL